MAKIDSFNFGFIVVDDKQYTHDVVILPDGTVKERNPEKAGWAVILLPAVRLKTSPKSSRILSLSGPVYRAWPG